MNKEGSFEAVNDRRKWNWPLLGTINKFSRVHVKLESPPIPYGSWVSIEERIFLANNAFIIRLVYNT